MLLTFEMSFVHYELSEEVDKQKAPGIVLNQFNSLQNLSSERPKGDGSQVVAVLYTREYAHRRFIHI